MGVENPTGMGDFEPTAVLEEDSIGYTNADALGEFPRVTPLIPQWRTPLPFIPSPDGFSIRGRVSSVTVPISERFSPCIAERLEPPSAEENGSLFPLVFHPLAKNVYNGTLVSPDLIIAREVLQAAETREGRDDSRLVVLRRDGTFMKELQIPLTTTSRGDPLQYEDPRIFINNGRIFMGVTAVFPGEPIPFSPAIVELTCTADGDLLPVGDPVICTRIDGYPINARNMTPIGYDDEKGLEVHFRIVDGYHDHIISHGWVKNGELLHNKDQDMYVSPDECPWTDVQVGTTGVPLTFADGIQIDFIHGKRDEQRYEETRGTFPHTEYAIGALQIQDGNITHATTRPLLQKFHFPTSKELHPDKDIVYITGNPIPVRVNAEGEFEFVDTRSIKIEDVRSDPHLRILVLVSFGDMDLLWANMSMQYLLNALEEKPSEGRTCRLPLVA